MRSAHTLWPPSAADTSASRGDRGDAPGGDPGGYPAGEDEQTGELGE